MERTASLFPAASGSLEPLAIGSPWRRTELLLIGGFWLLISALTIVNALLDPGGRGFQPLIFPYTPLVLPVVHSLLWGVLTPLIFGLAAKLSAGRTSSLTAILAIVAIGLIVAISVDTLMSAVRFQMFVSHRPLMEPGPAFRVRHFWFMNEFFVYLTLLAAGFARIYFFRYQMRRDETMRLSARAAELQAQLSDARLAALRTQLNPHFLFNTLHAVSALVERDPRGVRRMIARLSELLRSTLDGTDQQEVPLRRELEFLDRYLEIMRIRFQGRLEVEMSVDPAVLDGLVPNLVLQPLVENALKHGVEKIDGIGRVQIAVRRIADRAVVTVRDNGPAFSQSARGAEGVGLRNTRERLERLYGAEQSLTLRVADTGGLIAEVSLPFHTSADLRAPAIEQ